MATLMGVIGVIGITGMAGGFGASGYNAAHSISDLQANTKTMQDQTTALAKQFKTLESGQAVISADVMENISDNINELDVLQAKMDTSKDGYQKHKLMVEVSGIMFIAILFIMLILQYSGIACTIEKGIKHLFRKRPKQALAIVATSTSAAPPAAGALTLPTVGVRPK